MKALFLLLCLSLTIPALANQELTEQTTTRPNFVFIIADDCTFRDIGCYGGQAKTPNIDGLAQQGMKFTHCFQTAPMCSPTRHTIYTGLYPVKSGAYPNHTYAYDHVQSVCHFLQPLGYRVALSGKSHIAPKSVFPFEYSSKNNNPDMQAIDQLMAESAQARTPFCLFACSNEPHSPWNKGDASQYPPEQIQLPPYIVDTPEVRNDFSHYLAEITYYDDQVGQILKLLRKHKLTRNTMVMVVSEQGNSFPFAKWTCYDNGLQSAMIVRWPGHVEKGSTTDAIVEYVDVLPTFVAAAGGKPNPDWDGKSFLHVLKGNTTEHKFYTYGLMTTRGIINGSEAYPIRSIRDKHFRLVWNLNHEASFTNAVTNSRQFESMKHAEASHPEAKQWNEKYQHRPEWELYDVQADPLNIHNLTEDTQYAEEMKRLKTDLKAWMQQQGDEGMATELKANDRQKQGNKNKRKKQDV